MAASYTSFIAFSFLSIDTESSLSLLKSSSKVLIDQETVTLSNFFNKSKSRTTKSDFVHINSSASTPTNCSNNFLVFLYSVCHAKPISENLLLVACAQVINELFLTDSKVFAKIANVIDEVFQPRGASTTLADKIAKKEELEKTINLLLSERANATGLETRTLLDKQYVDACDKYSLILKEIEHLQDKEQAEVNLAVRYKRVIALIDGKQVTPEMINKDILDVFPYRIIVVDRNDIVITINVGMV